MASQWTTLHVDDHQTWAYFSLPEGPGPSPGVVVIQHGSGVDDFTRSMVGRLSDAGYAVIAPSLYQREDPDSGDTGGRFGRLRDENITKDVNAAIEMLSRHPAVRGDRIGDHRVLPGGQSDLFDGGNQPGNQGGRCILRREHHGPLGRRRPRPFRPHLQHQLPRHRLFSARTTPIRRPTT